FLVGEEAPPKSIAGPIPDADAGDGGDRDDEDEDRQVEDRLIRVRHGERGVRRQEAGREQQAIAWEEETQEDAGIGEDDQEYLNVTDRLNRGEQVDAWQHIVLIPISTGARRDCTVACQIRPTDLMAFSRDCPLPRGGGRGETDRIYSPSPSQGGGGWGV